MPVLDADRIRLVGWVAREDVVDAVAKRLEAAECEAKLGVHAAEWANDEIRAGRGDVPNALDGYVIVEIAVTDRTFSKRRTPEALALPEGWILAAVRPSRARRTVFPVRAEELQEEIVSSCSHHPPTKGPELPHPATAEAFNTETTSG